jgi:osmotically-inducible protein OsmY
MSGTNRIGKGSEIFQQFLTTEGVAMFDRFAPVTRMIVMMVGLLAAWAGFAEAVGGMPYRKMAQAAGSLLSARAQARDQRLQLALRRAIMQEQGLAGLQISPHVYMERGFVVGMLDNHSQAAAVMGAAHSVEGLRSLQFYLPARDSSTHKPSGGNAMASVGIAAAVKAALAGEPGLVVTRYEIKALEGEVVLLGVVADDQERHRVEAIARSTAGVTGVKDLLVIVEDPYAARRPRLR